MSNTVIELRDELNKLIKKGYGQTKVFHTDAFSTPIVMEGPSNVYVGSVWSTEDQIIVNSEEEAEYRDEGEVTEIEDVVVIECI